MKSAVLEFNGNKALFLRGNKVKDLLPFLSKKVKIFDNCIEIKNIKDFKFSSNSRYELYLEGKEKP